MNFLRLNLYALTLVVACLGLSASASAQIVALGASNTAGYGLSRSESFPAQLEAMLRAKGSNTTVINAGVSGETSAETLSRVSSAVPAGTKIVILNVFSFNDTRKGIPSTVTSQNIQTIKSQLSSRGIKVIDSSGITRAVSRQPGMLQPDHIHLTAEGQRRVAAQLLGMVR